MRSKVASNKSSLSRFKVKTENDHFIYAILFVANNSSPLLKLILLNAVRSQLEVVVVSVSCIWSTREHVDRAIGPKIASKKLHQVLQTLKSYEWT